MSKMIDLIGQQFGRLTVVTRRDKNAADGGAVWVCLCECGNFSAVYTGHLRNGHTTSCGCVRDELVASVNLTHGLSHTPEYKIWRAMLQRCHDPSCNEYSNYGGRGILVGDRWRDSFENFYADMGPRPSAEYSIDRENNNDGYHPNNCRWATPEEQHNNKRTNIFHDVDGQRKTVAQLSREHNIPETTLRRRISKGMNAEEALKHPLYQEIRKK